jgi:hypothetical protein
MIYNIIKSPMPILLMAKEKAKFIKDIKNAIMSRKNGFHSSDDSDSHEHWAFYIENGIQFQQCNCNKCGNFKFNEKIPSFILCKC